MNMKEKIKKIYILIGVLFLVCIGLFVYFENKDKGEYNYCIEWQGLNNGTLYRDNLLFTCFSLSQQKFYCDYEIDKKTNVLMIKPILNITKNDEGSITEIVYDQPNYFNCSRWLKSEEVK